MQKVRSKWYHELLFIIIIIIIIIIIVIFFFLNGNFSPFSLLSNKCCQLLFVFNIFYNNGF